MMEYGDSFYAFCKKLEIGGLTYCGNEMKYHFEITLQEFDLINKLGLVYNGTEGGLVLGKLHIDGGIHFLQPCGSEKLRYVGEMEGWEYLTAPINNYNTNEFFLINKQTKNINSEIDTSFKIPKTCKVIDTSNSEIAFILISHKSQFVINRFATKKHIDLIINLDQ